jgi:hypothetical protein
MKGAVSKCKGRRCRMLGIDPGRRSGDAGLRLLGHICTIKIARQFIRYEEAACTLAQNQTMRV